MILVVLPNDLLDELASWQATFDMAFGDFDGWVDDATRDAWAAEGAGLIEQVREALDPAFELEASLWPLEAAD